MSQEQMEWEGLGEERGESQAAVADLETNFKALDGL